MKGVWVLTKEHNDYDQHGEYFCCVFAAKPSVKALARYFGHTDSAVAGNVMEAPEFLENLRDGGGRQGTEDVWYNLEFAKFEGNGDEK